MAAAAASATAALTATSHLATWSRADAVVSHPIDPIALARELAGLVRERAAVAGA